MHWRRLDAPERIPDWLDARKARPGPYRTDLLPPSRQRWQQLQLLGTEGSTITIEAAEVCAAIAGVTVRRPFADVDLWEFFLRLPAEVKCPDQRDKTLARSLLRGNLPDSILDRRDKTYFDDHVMAQVDYATLRRLLATPRHRMPGVDYRRLAQRIEQGNFTRFDWFWAKDLACIHAFLNAWGPPHRRRSPPSFVPAPASGPPPPEEKGRRSSPGRPGAPGAARPRPPCPRGR